jgi:hypothetical protein
MFGVRNIVIDTRRDTLFRLSHPRIDIFCRKRRFVTRRHSVVTPSLEFGSEICSATTKC